MLLGRRNIYKYEPIPAISEFLINMADDISKKGTTTVGIACSDGVVLAADRRATLGHLAMHNVDKVFEVTKFIGMASAGTVSDMQVILKWLKTQLDLYKYNKDAEPTVDTAAALLSNVLFGGVKSFFPHMVFVTIGGKSDEGFKLFSLDPSGSSITDKYVAGGSGMELAYGVLEEGYKEGMKLEDAKKLAVKALTSAIRRDVYSGQGLDLFVIDSKGFKKVDSKKFTEILKD